MFPLRLALVACALVALAPPPAAQDRVSDLRFQRGEYATTVEGVVRGYDVRDFVFRARRGQTIRVTLRSPGSAEFLLLDNDTMDNLMRGSDTDLEGRLPYTGPYRLRVLHPLPAAQRGEASRFTLYVEII